MVSFYYFPLCTFHLWRWSIIKEIVSLNKIKLFRPLTKFLELNKVIKSVPVVISVNILSGHRGGSWKLPKCLLIMLEVGIRKLWSMSQGWFLLFKELKEKKKTKKNLCHRLCGPQSLTYLALYRSLLVPDLE